MTRLRAILIVVLVAVFGAVFWLGRLIPSAAPDLGVTFSTTYASWLGLDSRETWTALAEDLRVERMRIPVYWSEVEPEHGRYRWEELDWMMEEAGRRGIEVTLVVGEKGPRWPECYIPDWAEMRSVEDRHAASLAFLEETVRRYRRSPALVRWQVENEPFFPFGVCPGTSFWQLMREVDRVRDLDDKPLQLTVSGELEPWLYAAIPADVLGVSLYRTTWNRVLGYTIYPFPPAFYWFRSLVSSPFVDEVVISELQAEPWFPEPVKNREPKEWYPLFDADHLRQNVDFARQTGVSEIYLWGAEWWYYLKVHGEPRLWDTARELFQEAR
jgi:hypothetical protein